MSTRSGYAQVAQMQRLARGHAGATVRAPAQSPGQVIELPTALRTFVASFGMDPTGADEYADHWRQAERDGTLVTAVLVRLAGAPPATQIAQMPGPGDGQSRQVDMMLMPAAFNDFDSPDNRAQIDGLFADILGDSYVDDSSSTGRTWAGGSA